MKSEIMYVAVRHCEDGYDWMDKSTLDYVITGTQAHVQHDKEKYGAAWVNANKVVRYARVRLVEEQ